MFNCFYEFVLEVVMMIFGSDVFVIVDEDGKYLVLMFGVNWEFEYDWNGEEG